MNEPLFTNVVGLQVSGPKYHADALATGAYTTVPPTLFVNVRVSNVAKPPDGVVAMLNVPPLATTVVPVPLPVEAIDPPDQFNVPEIANTPLPSKVLDPVNVSVPLKVTFAPLDPEVPPTTSVAPFTETPDRLAPLPRSNVPASIETTPGAEPTNDPVPELDPPVSLRPPDVADTLPALSNAGFTGATAVPALLVKVPVALLVITFAPQERMPGSPLFGPE